MDTAEMGAAEMVAAPIATAGAGTIRLRYFAWLRERVGRAEETLALPTGVGDVGSLIGLLRARGPAWDGVFASDRVVRCAVNQAFATAEAPVRPGDEIAFFPPVTGG